MSTAALATKPSLAKRLRALYIKLVRVKRLLITPYSSILSFFIALLLIATFTLLFFAPDFKGEFAKDGEIPKLELVNFKLAEFHKSLLYMVADGTSLLQFDNREVIRDYFIRRDLNSVDDIISGRVATRFAKRYVFDSGVTYTRGDDMAFYTDGGVYYLDEDVFVAHGDFTMQTDEMNSKGINLIYDRANGRLSAQKITTYIDLDAIDAKKSSPSKKAQAGALQ